MRVTPTGDYQAARTATAAATDLQACQETVSFLLKWKAHLFYV